LLGPGVENDPAQGELGLISMLKAAPQGLLDVAKIPGEVMQGRAEPSVENAMALTGLMGGGGLLAPRVPSSLGMFGGDMRSAVGSPRFAKIGDSGMITQRIRLPSGASGEVVSLVSKSLNKKNTVDMTLNFSVIDPKTGRLTSNLAGLPAKEGRAFLTAALNEARHHIELIKPGVISFSAASPSLIPLYRRLTKQIAKETGGKVIPPKSKFNRFFEVDLPNPRIFEATGKGLLDTP